MGSGIAVNCNKCGFKKEFYVGIGFMYGDLDNLIDSIPKRQREEISKIIQEYKISTHNNFMFDSLEIEAEFPHLRFEDKIYRCTKCNLLSTRLWVKIQYNEHLYEIKYKCYKCKEDLDLIEINVDEEDFVKKYPRLPCPKCSYKYLEISPGGTLWD